MMNSILLILTGAILVILFYILIKNIIKNKTEYEPTGRIGYLREHTGVYNYVLIVEEIDSILNKRRIKIKILEVDIDTDCDKTKKECLKHYGGPTWVLEKNFVWNKKTAAEIREEKIDGLVGKENNNA